MEDMQNQNTIQPSPQTYHAPKKHGLVLNLTLCAAIVVAAIAGVYVWQHQKVADARSQNKQLTAQLSTAKAQLQAAQKTAAGSSAKPSQQIVYKAAVGKFTLTLPDKYVFIVGNDSGGANGGTQLTIGDKTADSSIVDSSTSAPVMIEAYGLHGRSFDSLVRGYTSDRAPFGKKIVQIDGVAAESYMFGGESAPRGIYFTKGDMFYRIELGDTGGSIDQKLDAIIAGFAFN